MKINKLIIVAYRIPFKVVGGKLVQNSGGLVSAILSLAHQLKKSGQIGKDQKISWIGYSESFFEENQNSTLYSNEEFEVVPVQLDDELNNHYYGGFCNGMIWPLFHYYPFLTKFNEEEFEAYKTANRLFLEAVSKVYEEGDLLWIHDYQLMLLPCLVKKTFPSCSIGFFLHIPFPSYELFRLLPEHWQTALLNGMLGADLIGFHINDYSQHFLNSLSRVLGFEHRIREVNIGDRTVKVDAFPISIDYDKFYNAYDDPKVVEFRQRILKEQGENKILFSVDRLDYSKGLLHRLQGYEFFLERNPHWKEKIVFFMVVVPSRDSIVKYKEMKQELEETVGRINGLYGTLSWRPVVYIYNSLNFTELVGLYSVCDVALITPVRDGMNLVSKEFVASRKDKNGVLILSSMAGAAAELNGAIQINPTDKNQIADSIEAALHMSPVEKEMRIESMQSRIRSYDVFKWSEDFMVELEKIKTKQKLMEIRLIDSKILQSMKRRYQSAKRKLFLFDYDGTLAPYHLNPSQATPSEMLLDFLRSLATKEDHHVAIISGRDVKFMETWFLDIPLYLAAEHGAFLKTPEGEWEDYNTQSTLWKDIVLPLLKSYVDRCPGSFIENKSSTLCWHYRKSEKDFAFIRSRELLDELLSLTNKLNLTVLDGNKVIEVKPIGNDKGEAIKKMIERIEPDFIMCMGDDVTDEDMFMALPENAISIKIGNAPTHAQYNLMNQQQVLTMLHDLVYTTENITH